MATWGQIATNLLTTTGPNTLSNYTSVLNTVKNSIIKKTDKYILGTNGLSYATDIKTVMSGIEWSRGYSWDVRLDKVPSPFGEGAFGIPVIEVQDMLAVGQSYDADLANSSYRFPRRKTVFDVKLTMLDDENGTMEQYFEKWFNDVYSWDNGPLNGTIQYLSEAVRQLDVTKLNSKKEEIFKRSYLVYPESEMMGYNNSTGNVRTYSITLVVAGYLGKSNERYGGSVSSGGSELAEKIAGVVNKGIDSAKEKIEYTYIKRD